MLGIIYSGYASSEKIVNWIPDPIVMAFYTWGDILQGKSG